MAVNPSALGQNKGLSELWKRLRFVLMAVIIYRMGTHIPIPGIDPDKLANIFQQNQGTLLDLFNIFFVDFFYNVFDIFVLDRFSLIFSKHRSYFIYIPTTANRLNRA